MCLGLTGKLGRAWVVNGICAWHWWLGQLGRAWYGAWHGAWGVGGGGGDVG